MAQLEQFAAPGSEWWRSAVIYQIYPRSWADGNGDGIGDLPGVTARLPYLKALGVDAVWFSPFYRSPQADAGYDVADYRDIDPLFGTLADADAMLASAKELGLKVIVDLVPNHTSDEHAWFQAALAAGPGSPERERYLFRDGKGTDGTEPPNDWRSVFGGPGWTRVTEADGTPGQWYLHLFDAKQPDLDWTNPQVRTEFESVLRDEPGVGQEGLDFLMPFLRDAVQQASLQPARAELHPAAWMAALDSLIGEDVDEAERNALARQLNAAIEPMTDPKTGLALEFANRIQTEGHQAALDWLQRQRAAGEGEDPAPAPAPVGGEPANAQSIIRSRSRRLRGPPV